MFELGKKDGSEHRDEFSAQAASRDSGSGASSSRTSASSRETAVIGRSIRIDGDLQGEEDLRIEGDVNGTVRLQNHTLTIGSEGNIRADVYSKAVVIDGKMEGDIFSSERVAIRQNATVLGNITAPRVSLEDGAKFKGSIEMDPEAVKSSVGKTETVTSISKTGMKAKTNGSKPAAQSKAKADDDVAANESAG